MSLIARPRWTRQPQGAVEVDWSNPLTRGMRLAYSPADRLERVSNKFIPTTGSVPKGFGLRSSGATFTNSTSNYLGATTNGSPIQTTTADYRMSLLAVVIPNSTATQQVFVALNGTGTQRTNLQMSATGQPGYLVRQVNGGTAAGVTATQTVSVGQQVVIGGVTYAQNSHTVYVNGISGGTTTTSLTAGDSTYDRHYIGIDIPGSIGASAPARALIQLVLGWNRALSAAEMYALSSNPWQIFKPVTRTIGAVISGVTISRPNSDITVTGWVGDPDNTNLYANIDEAVASDTDFIISPAINATPGPAVFGITPTQASGTYNVRLRAKRTGATGDIRALLLDSGGATVGTSSWQALTGSFAQYTLSVTTTGTAARVQLEVRA